MAGDTRMTIHGWKQLGEWSIEHSCITKEEIVQGLRIYRDAFEAFCRWVVEEYSDMAAGLNPGGPATR